MKAAGILAQHRDCGCTGAMGGPPACGFRGEAGGPYPAGGERSVSNRNLQDPR